MSKEDVDVKVKQHDTICRLPTLPLRDVVVYPHMVIPLFVGRAKSVNALEAAMIADKQIFLVAQKNASTDDPDIKSLFNVGIVANILQLLKLPDGTVKILVEGVQRARAKEYREQDNCLNAILDKLDTVGTDSAETDILTRSLVSQFEQYLKLNKKIPPEILTSLTSIDESERLTDTIAAHISLKIEDKQSILEELDLQQRIEKVMSLLEVELDLLQVEQRVRGRIKRQMEKNQREYYLNEQVKAIQKELGELGDELNEMDQLAKNIETIGMPKEAKEKAKSELKKLKMMPPMSAEATVIRNYLDCMLGVPWKKRSRLGIDLQSAEGILNADHCGLEKVKERIIEYLAVQQRVKHLKGPILCLVGPPGVGKTSLGQSIANATGRKFVRIALGGVRDEAEIRGHRRTYIGSMPGKIIQKLSKVKVKNPLIMLDEVDKMAMDFRGDPTSALLEVLDPEQNHTFADHYLEVDYDLSEVMFIATANSLEIPPALLDRMEVIRLAGYTEEEKIQIAMEHLIPNQLKQNGLKESEIKLSEGAIHEIIRYYTREAGVRNLEREIAKVSRKVVKELLQNSKKKSCAVTQKNSEKYLGVRRFRYGLAGKKDQVGQVTGLAWTSVGGELLTIEASTMPGKGKSTYTGQLGDVMQESIQTALTVVRSRTDALGIDPKFYETTDIHIHVPEGATPKDGPSAGIGMCSALVSVLTNIPVKADVAMTGEITLSGQVLPIGGLKEKLLAALRGEIKHVLIPRENEPELVELPKNILQGLTIHPVGHIDEVLKLALIRQPKPISKANGKSRTAKLKKPAKSKNKDLHTH